MRDGRSYIRTMSGGKVWPLDPLPEDIVVEDIAHALSHLCRFGGHTSQFYSVAQHSIVVSEMCPPEWRLVGLLHDAAEAYLGDFVRPVKRQILGVEYGVAEKRLLAVIFQCFGLDPALAWEPPAVVLAADNWALVREARMLMPPDPDWELIATRVRDDGCLDLTSIPMVPIMPHTPQLAYAMFLSRFAQLKTDRG